MKKLRITRTKLLVTCGIALLIGLGFLVKVSSKIDDQKECVVTGIPDGVKVQIVTRTYDYGLVKSGIINKYAVENGKQVTLQSAYIQAPIVRVAYKWITTITGTYSACENCFGPNRDVSVVPIDKMQLKEGEVLKQKREESNGVLNISLYLTKDENAISTRPFEPKDMDKLVQECQDLIKLGKPIDENAVLPDSVKEVNPVRVEVGTDCVILWMGGKKGIAISNKARSMTALNMVMVSGTSNDYVFNLDKM